MHTNRLSRETSPYLRQHAHNPVDWFPWGDEAIAKARELDRPIFLSIGYSACHWCHVMERESFEDETIGQLLNEHFVSIKVDREERPDLDQIYMAAVQLLTQHGGWPMSVWLTPALKPFYGGTYFPPRDLYGRPSFRRVLEALVKAWKEQRDAIEENAVQLTGSVQEMLHLVPGEGTLDAEMLRQANAQIRRRFDPQYGGFGAAPKFPHPMELRLLLRIADRFDDDTALSMVQKTLDGMARGGMYDQLGGGFHRYSTDAQWLVPHFEKMLYDNALLVPAYLEAFQVTKEPFYRTIAEETLDYVVREMTSPDGPFYSTQDADSEGEEGKFFVWSAAEVEQVLGKDDADFFGSVFDVTPGGNWEGVNILHRVRSDEQDAALLKLPLDDFRKRVARCKAKLLEVRSRRIWPGRDEKILTAWNGIMIGAFADASQVLDKPAYAQAAKKAADYLLRAMRSADGRLLRTTFAGAEAKLNGYLEDYSYLIDGLVSLYEATFESRWLTEAAKLADVLVEQFWDAKDGGFFYTGKDHESLIARTKDPHDNATPSGNAMAVTGLLRLARLTGRTDLQEKAEKTLDLFRGVMSDHPLAAGQMLIALDFHLGPVREIVVLGDPASDPYREALRLIRSRFRPHTVLAGGEADLPLLAGRRAEGPLAVFVCENGTCQSPVHTIADLELVLSPTSR
jgi:uncharacterized protein YyaL (SSP411 family)